QARKEEAAKTTEWQPAAKEEDVLRDRTPTERLELPRSEIEAPAADAVEPFDELEPADVPRRHGPGFGARTVLVLASLLSGMTAYMYCHKRGAQHPASVATTAPADAALVVIASDDAPPDAAEVVVAAVDAAEVVVAA